MIGTNFEAAVLKIVCAYVANNSVPAADLTKLIETVHVALHALQHGYIEYVPMPALWMPSSVQIRQSVQRDGIVSFIDGRSYKTLKRHLSAHGLHPQSYRERYGLPANYPMVAPGYAAKRSQIARALGLGRLGVMDVPEAQRAA